ncbi:MAG: 23S rRNA pseudouridine(2604) synthase RluF, partial [Myroides sp.]
DKTITDRFIQRMSAGVPILDTVTKECRVEKISSTTFRIFLTQGLNRQIRRMCEYFDYTVVALKRIRIINISLDVPVGKYRDITKAEMDELNRLIGESIKTEEGSLPKTDKPLVNKNPAPTKDRKDFKKKIIEQRPLRNERRNTRNK